MQAILAAEGFCGHKSKRRCNIMAKLSAKYEILYIIDPALVDQTMICPGGV